ncbi:alpha-mannosidase [Paenibacillus guangzhouensis]|uniref:alpha-mannosidase n=1 Tax=Paenibacillus guangzhouensis TaxID=1473112 RepID=UPI001266907E|nr:alpha-mannosidase [Paenibacillus guangzhouensis]
MSQSKTVHIISHTHWDREWYLPYEKHHVLLIKLMDTLMETLERDEEYRSFHLDGQTIILEDYLQVRPEMRAKLEHYIREGRIHIGPWYILQDEFLTSSEANVRNLLIGHRDAAAYGTISKLGYFPDSFGNMGQAPQMLKQAGIQHAVFGRGVKPTGFNNEVTDVSAYESPYSEMWWESPDGSKVLGILFANWYSNGNEVPAEAEAAKIYWDKKLADAEKYASTRHLLFMNGCDHQPVQTDLSEAIKTAEQLYPDVTFVHSNFDDYLEQVGRSLPDNLSVIRGELRSQHTDGWGTLVNTASSRVYMKQKNQQGQTALEKVAEPLAAMAYMLGQSYPHHLFNYAWKTLMQNHPHDSICGCSVDEVHAEMMTRFEKSRHVAEAIADESLAWIADRADTSSFAAYGTDAVPFVVSNTTGWVRSGSLSVELEVKRIYFRSGMDFGQMRREVKEYNLDGFVLVDSDGVQLPCTVEDLGIQFGYDLPEDQFRQPYFARSVRVTFEAVAVPALGYRAYGVVRTTDAASNREAASLITDTNQMENDKLIVAVEVDGTLTVTDKSSGVVYRGLGTLEDTGDIGNEYMYREANGTAPITTRGVPAAAIHVVRDTPYQAAIEIVHELEIPIAADDLLELEQREIVWFTGRRAGRSSQMTTMRIVTHVSLNRHGEGVEVACSFNNQAKDHRLRMLFPTGLRVGTHYADSIFEVPERSSTPAEEWKNPSNCHHQQAFVTVSGEEAGLTIANQGLNEYEVIQGEAGDDTIAVTLLRAVGELGDWGYFPTPEAQCQGEHSVKLCIIPFTHEERSVDADPRDDAMGSIVQAYQFQVPWSTQQAEVHEGSLPATHSFVSWEGPSLAFSAMKVAEASGDIILRWFNVSTDVQALNVALHAEDDIVVYRSDILERQLERLVQAEDGALTAPIRPAEIVTLSFAK